MSVTNFEDNSDRQTIAERLADHRVGSQVILHPRVSVVIPAYNVAPFIVETLESVFSQTYNNFEVIVVNDGSPDTAELESKLIPFYDRIVYARQMNLGASEARNTAIRLAKGEYLAFLDGDDIWERDFLLSQVAFLEQNEYDMVYCDAEMFGEDLFDGRRYMEMSPSKGAVTTESLISGHCNVITSGTVLRHEWLRRVGLFDRNMGRIEDFDLWFRLARSGAKIGYQPNVLLRYRVRLNSLSGNSVERTERGISGLNAIREKYGLNPTEEIAWKKQMANCLAEHEVELGKLSLTRGDYREARKHVARANEHCRKPKLVVILVLLSVAPSLVLKIFKHFRPAEYSFIAPHKS